MPPRPHLARAARRRLAAAVTAALTAASAITATATADEAPPPPPTTSPTDAPRTLADAPRVEHLTLDRLRAAGVWPRRALAIMRLERYACPESTAAIRAAVGDPAWQVRAFAFRSLAGRPGVDVDDVNEALATEENPRVIRTALRAGFTIDRERLARGVRMLARSSRLDEKLLAAELGAATDDPELRETARDLTRTVINRADRVEGGVLSPRFAQLTGSPDLGRAFRWRSWLIKVGRSFALAPPVHDQAATSVIATLPPERFAALVSYIEKLADRSVDLAICIDCTASMSGELAAAQRGVDDLMRFVGDVTANVRIGIVGYRDRRGEFETRGWDLTDDLDLARAHLWSLSAAGGGDRAESVLAGLKLAYTEMAWDPDAVRVLVLVGDAPPHPGEGTICVDLARRGASAGLVTHTVEADDEPVEHFTAIAEAGEGQCVRLEDDHALIAEIAGLTIGDTFAESFRAFFGRYFALCR